MTQNNRLFFFHLSNNENKQITSTATTTININDYDRQTWREGIEINTKAEVRGEDRPPNLQTRSIYELTRLGFFSLY